MNDDFIGYAGSFFIGINLIPQIIHIYLKKNADSISVTANILNISASILMIDYAILINKNPILASNMLVLLSSIIILFLKWKYNKVTSLNKVQCETEANLSLYTSTANGTNVEC
jgi:MtN3 and saliva related transmembrane protein